MPWTYIVECSDGSFYVGSTWNLERRISEHNEGIGAAYTKRRRPVRLVWAADFERIDAAYAYRRQPWIIFSLRSLLNQRPVTGAGAAP